MKCRDLLYIAFREAGVLKRPQALDSNNELLDGLIFLNQLIDYWAARDCYAYTTAFQVYTLAGLHQPTQIGPGLTAPDWDSAALRPTGIISANLVLPGTVDTPINIRDNAWWASQQLKAMQTSIPTDLWYQAASPNGLLWFWPVPNIDRSIRLETNVVLKQFVTLDDTFIGPQAYQAALTLSLAEELTDIWGLPAPPNLARRAMKARDALQSNNNLPPRISSADWGTRTGPPGDFNWLSGTVPTRRS